MSLNKFFELKPSMRGVIGNPINPPFERLGFYKKEIYDIYPILRAHCSGPYLGKIEKNNFSSIDGYSPWFRIELKNKYHYDVFYPEHAIKETTINVVILSDDNNLKMIEWEHGNDGLSRECLFNIIEMVDARII